MQKRLLILGSTGSIGTQTLELVRQSCRIQGASGPVVTGLCAHSSVEDVAAQVAEFRPPLVAMADPGAADELKTLVPKETKVFGGADAALELIGEASYDVAIHGIVGAAGLGPTLAVLGQGRTLGLANKESLVIAGQLVMETAKEHGATILPVDSEHSAVFQCLQGEDPESIRRVHLTASGGPFRTASPGAIAAATPKEALAHPNWDMGPRVTIGSATLMNKALEVIELHHLFSLPAQKIHVVVHPQSIVHSMVEFVDGSVMAQLGPPDMRGPIQYAIHYPKREVADLEGFSFERFANLTFEEPDRARFPALDLAFRCVAEGGASGAILNAADEVAAQAFLDGAISLPDIPKICASALDAAVHPARLNLASITEADAWARSFARDSLAQFAGPPL